MATAEERRDELKRVYVEASDCTRCPVLAQERRTVVFGSGHADADVLFLGEAPGRLEDEQGLPVVGPQGKLLSELLEGVSIARSDVYVANLLKCRPPGNRDPLPAELANCRGWLDRQLELIRPKVVCTLGNFATKLVREDPTGITKLHGQVEERTIGPVAVRLLPLYAPAAALYTRTLMEQLQADIAQLPGLLELDAPEQPGAVVAEPEPEPVAPEPEPEPESPPDEEEGQLGLF